MCTCAFCSTGSAHRSDNINQTEEAAARSRSQGWGGTDRPSAAHLLFHSPTVIRSEASPNRFFFLLFRGGDVVGDGWSQAGKSITSQPPDYRLVRVFMRRGSRRDAKLRKDWGKKNLLRRFHGARVYACERGGEWKNMSPHTHTHTRKNLEKVSKCFTAPQTQNLLAGRTSAQLRQDYTITRHLDSCADNPYCRRRRLGRQKS